MKKVLLTGATGFIGDQVMNELLKLPVSVIATSFDEEKAKQREWFGKVRYIPFDFRAINESADYFSYFGRPDILIHLAWEGLPNYKSFFHVDVNLPLHIKFLGNLARNGLKDITVTGTCFEYGMQEGCLREDMPAMPVNPYGLAKDSLRKELERMQQDYNFTLKWVRLFYMYGRGQNPNSLLSQLEKALATGEKVFNMSGGEQIRDFMPVEEVASAIVSIAFQNKISGIINCCSGKPVKVMDFVRSYLREKSKDLTLNLGYYPYPDYEPMAFWGDNTKLKTIRDNE